ncbi:MAG: MogA/MoaB family molybdenum cofactor biosynthesis protein [Oscillospiraceae bacterium]|nr:MogA/MoaB family molybdenum cofactor biosynthesis protein [Oscillospiraceae bacterium]
MSKRVYVITSSDSCYAGEREDISGPTAIAMLREAGWELTGYAVLPDERQLLAEKLRAVCDGGLAELLITTGGTGFSQRDCMPEVTAEVAERMVPGIPEAMRWYSLQITPRAMLSRAAAGLRGNTLIVNLPGSPKAVRENLGAILDTLPHAMEMLRGGGH